MSGFFSSSPHYLFNMEPFGTLSSPLAVLIHQPNQLCEYVGVATAAALAVIYWSYRASRYNHIPAMTDSNFFMSYLAALRFPSEGKGWVLDGYKKFKDQIFRFPQMSRWHLVITDDQLIDELSRAPPDTLSIKAAFDENLLAKYMLGETVTTNRYHVSLIRSQLTRNIISLFSDVTEEVMLAIQDNFPLTKDWTAMTVYNPISQVVARASNRVFVGLPLCRNYGYISVNLRHAREVAKGMETVSYFPDILKPLAAKSLTNVPRSVKAVCEYIRPLVEERQEKIDKYGADYYPGKSVDFLSWMMDEAQGEERTPEALANRIIHVNFVSLHTSIMTFTHALYNLAAYPEYMQPLREEVESIVANEGWTRAAVSRMRKLDSFFKETLRLNSFSIISMTRLALKDYVFSNGTKIPKGAMISAAIMGRHLDNELYENSETFDGFRFSRKREKDDQNTPNEFVSTSVDYLAFGHGTHGCPGRFFAANELKIMMAYLIMHYDIKMKSEGVRPKNIFHGLECRPDVTAEILFRGRQV